MRYDDSAAEVLVDSGNRRSRNEHKLGMVVQVAAGAVGAASATALARRVRWANELVGPVGSVNLGAATVQVLGQTVQVASSTVFDSSLAGGLSALSAGAVVAVHGILDTANVRIVATRIAPNTGATDFSQRGAVASLGTTAKTLRNGDAAISHAGLAAPDAPASLAKGAEVRLQPQTAQVSGFWVATRLGRGLHLSEAGRPDADVEDAITAFTSTASLVVNGLTLCPARRDLGL